jgi:2-polyprenyl-6-methoxyphenol hydroxylase-like FAD-dependent oxidoreductase
MSSAGRTDVLVVGAGPVGLLLAGDLARQGVDVLVAERRPTPMTESRASLLTAGTMELLARRGLTAVARQAEYERSTHFAGIPVDLTVVRSPYAGAWKLPQFRTEAVLHEYAAGAGAALRRRHVLTGLVDGEHDVTAVLRAYGRDHVVHARYVVGCDGARSTVRELAGITTTTSPPTLRMLRADVKDAHVRPRRLGRTPHGVVAAAPSSDGVTRLMVHAFTDPGSNCSTTIGGLGEVAARWRHATGEDLGSGAALVHAEWFDDRDELADQYRRGRVLLAGDAAHDHLPTNGQALNLGLADAADLGWRLVAALRSGGSPDALDSYEQERRPLAQTVMRNVRAQVALLFGDTRTSAMTSLLAELLALPSCHDEIARVLSGTPASVPGHPSGSHEPTGRAVGTAAGGPDPAPGARGRAPGAAPSRPLGTPALVGPAPTDRTRPSTQARRN